MEVMTAGKRRDRSSPCGQGRLAAGGLVGLPGFKRKEVSLSLQPVSHRSGSLNLKLYLWGQESASQQV